MENSWNWIAAHWGTWVISGAFGFAGGMLGGTFKWFYPSRMDWSESRTRRAQAKIDSKVLTAISDYDLWKSSRPMTGAGIPAVRAEEIAEAISLDLDSVADGLERLGQRGLVRKSESSVPPYWWHVPR